MKKVKLVSNHIVMQMQHSSFAKQLKLEFIVLQKRKNSKQITSADELPALIDEVRGQFIVSHELLKTQEVQTACAQAGQK